MRFLILCAYAFFFCLLPVSLQASPLITERVSDYASILTKEQKQKITRLLIDFESQTTNQIAIVTLPTLDNRSIEDVTYEAFNQFKLGQKKQANGVLIVLAVKEHKMRIEVGKGLEGDLTDLQTQIIQKESMAPEFKKGNYAAGLEAGVEKIIQAITKEPAQASTKPNTYTPRWIDLFILLIPFLATVMALRALFRKLMSLGSRGQRYNSHHNDYQSRDYSSYSSNNSSDNDSFSGGGGDSSGGGSSSDW